jgi:hypothetical protein
LEYRTTEGLTTSAPIVAARFVELEEGHMLLLWIRLDSDEVEAEKRKRGYEDSESED